MRAGDGDNPAFLQPQRGNVVRVDIGGIGGGLGLQFLERVADRIEPGLGTARDQAEVEALLGRAVLGIFQQFRRHRADRQIEAMEFAFVERFDQRVRLGINHRRAAGGLTIGPYVRRLLEAAGNHQVEEFLLGRLAVHRQRAAVQHHRDPEVMGERPEHLVFVDHIARRGRHGFGVAGVGFFVPPFGEVGDVLALEALRGREHHCGALGAGAHPRVDLHEQLEIIQRADHLGLIGEAHHRIAANRDQRAHLAFAGRQDLVRQHVAGHFPAEMAEAPEARFRHPFRAEHRHRRGDLRAARGLVGAEHARDRGLLALLLEAGADGVEAGDEIFGERPVACHFGASAGGGAALGAARKHPCGGDQLILVEACAFRGDLGREGLHRLGQLVEAVDVSRDEIAIIQPFGDDHVEHARQHRRILARLHRQVDIGQPRDIAFTRVGDDQLQSLGLLVADAARGAEGRHAPDRRIVRDDRVVADEQRDVAFREGVRPGHPLAVARRGEHLGGLIERHRGVEIAAADSVGEGERGRHRGRVLEAAGAHEHCHRMRAIGVDDAA